VRRELPAGAGSGRALGIIRAVFAALADPAGVTAHRPGALERAHLTLGDWRDTRARLAGTEARMCAVPEELGLAGLVTTIAGLTVTGAAAILAETGDPARFATARALDGHAGLCPRDNSSGAHQGKTPISGRGRPALRLAAWRAVWAAMPNNPVMAAWFGTCPPARTTGWPASRPARPAPQPCCAGSMSSSPGG
jgi:transposase